MKNETNDELVAAVKAHAYKHYNEGGWDYVIETMSDDDIKRQIRICKTKEGAVAKMKILTDLLGDIREDMAQQS